MEGRDPFARPRGPRAAAALALLLACAPAPPAPGPAAGASGGSLRPAGCRPVAAGSDLQVLLDAAEPGAALCLAPGAFPGPLRVRRRVALFGPREAVIRSGGSGTTITLEARGAALLGLRVEGSGGRFDLLDAAVRITADEVRVEGVAIRGALFGLEARQARGLLLRGNEIEGDPGRPLGLRGDAIRLWEVRESRVEDNRVRDARDVVIWYSPGNRIAGNEISGGRYGTHFMYSHENAAEENRYVGNVVGIYAMYSRGLVIRRNLVARSAGAAGVGLGFKEAGSLAVLGNQLLANTVGVYLDASPLDPRDVNRFEDNAFRLGDAGVVFAGSAGGNRFLGNQFRDNRVQVRVEGRGAAQDAEWRGNAFDDYAGYDLDGDGRGDVPYELRSLAGELAAREPGIAFFRGTAALGLVELVGRLVPLFRPQTLLVDPEPRLRAHPPGSARAG